MKYRDLILKNPFRNKNRSIFAIVGIGIGIMTIVALGLITGGMEDSINNALDTGDANIQIKGSVDNVTDSARNLNESYVDSLKNIPGVKKVGGQLGWHGLELRDDSTIEPYVMGMNPDDLNLSSCRNINGSVYSNGSYDVVIGKTLAKDQNKSIGDTIKICDHDFKITGIYGYGNMFTDCNAYVSLSTLQNITNMSSTLSFLYIETDNSTNESTVVNSINSTYGDNLTIMTLSEQTDNLSEVTDTLKMGSLAISLLAIFIGGIGIINTMMMNVYERTKEIGVLRAVGWSSRKIMVMIMGETLVLTLISAILGSLAGIILCEIGMFFIGDNTIFSLSFKPETFILAFAVAIIVGIIGGIYPAYKASKLEPTEALKYE